MAKRKPKIVAAQDAPTPLTPNPVPRELPPLPLPPAPMNSPLMVPEMATANLRGFEMKHGPLRDRIQHALQSRAVRR